MGLTAGILCLMDWSRLADALTGVSLAACLAAGLATALAQALTGLRWYVMIRGFATGSVLWHLRHYSLSLFLNAFTPANLGGDAYRLLSLRRSGNSGVEAAFLLLRERYFGLLGYCGFFMICLGLVLAGGGSMPAELIPASWAIGGAVLMLFFLSPLLSLAESLMGQSAPRSRKLLPLLGQARQAVAFPLNATLLACMALTVANTALWVLAGTLVARDLGIPVSFATIGMVAVLVELARWVPIAVQGIGLREGLYAVLLSLFGVAATDGFVIGGVLYMILSIVLMLSGALAAGLGVMAGPVTVPGRPRA